ncbi:unnamed protein product, partial [Discosporangium mesarthrocarpum]
MERRPVDFAMGQSEVARRRSQLDELRKDVVSVRGVGGGAGGLMAAEAGLGMGMGSRLEQQRETMREHDRMLEDLGRGVSRLHTQSRMIGDETALQVRLLDEMDTDADRASSGLRAEAKRAEKASKGFFFFLCVFV